MQQAVMAKPGEITFREVDDPVCEPGQALVKVMRIGICGSDMHVYYGKHPYTAYPVVQGHEVSGEIIEVCGNQSGLKRGDKVTIQPQIVYGKCYSCRHGRYNICDELKVMGFQTTGTASTLFAVDQSKVTKLPDEMSFDEGAMIEPLAVALHAIRTGEDVEGKNVLVLGAGPIGNLVAQTAKGFGAAHVMVTDISDYRIGKAAECGIDYCVNTQKENLGKAIERYFGPNRADKIYDCAGNNTTVSQSISLARRGTQIIVVATVDITKKWTGRRKDWG